MAKFLAGDVTQVKESIPWVRCASGNVFQMTSSWAIFVKIYSVNLGNMTNKEKEVSSPDGYHYKTVNSIIWISFYFVDKEVSSQGYHLI